MASSGESPILTALATGLALAGAPGPVQAVLLTESVRGGVSRGLRALAGVHGTFGALMVGLAMGLSVATPSGLLLRVLKVGGGALLIWLAIDGLRARRTRCERPPPAALGASCPRFGDPFRSS